jgi:hypothetical protein
MFFFKSYLKVQQSRAAQQATPVFLQDIFCAQNMKSFFSSNMHLKMLLKIFSNQVFQCIHEIYVRIKNPSTPKRPT